MPGAVKESTGKILVLPRSTKEIDRNVFTDIVLSAGRVCSDKPGCVTSRPTHVTHQHRRNFFILPMR